MRRLAAAMSVAISLTAAAAPPSPLAYEQQTIRIGDKAYTVQVPQGYVLELLTTDLDGPRLPIFAANGDLYIGSKSGKVYRVPPPYTHPEVLVTVQGYPHSVAFRHGEILIARTNGLYHAPYQPGQPHLDRDALSLLAALPGGDGHNSRTVAVGPDGRIYVSLGISGNCSDQYLGDDYPFEGRRGGIMVLREGKGRAEWQPYATGLRNPVGFGWRPGTGVLYADNNGPDHWGFNEPPEYFVRVEPGDFFGMPWFQFANGTLQRDHCISSPPPRPALEVTLPVITFPSRNAPLGMAFVPPGALEPALARDAVVALHGSWGTRPNGGFFGDPATRRPPKLVAVRFAEGRPQRVDDLVTGFQLQDGTRWARPAGVAVGSDGALYFTSDSDTNGLFRLRRAR